MIAYEYRGTESFVDRPHPRAAMGVLGISVEDRFCDILTPFGFSRAPSLLVLNEWRVLVEQYTFNEST